MLINFIGSLNILGENLTFNKHYALFCRQVFRVQFKVLPGNPLLRKI